MKNFKRFTTIFLTCLLVFCMFSGCMTGVPSTSDQSSGNDTQKPQVPIDLETTHGGKAEPTSKMMVEDGKSSYTIVYPEDADSNAELAASYLQERFYEATGVQLAVITDESVTYSADLKAISIGATALAEQAGVSFSYAGETEKGFQIKTVGDSVFVVGGSLGVIYGSYELLTYLFDWDYFGEFSYYIDTGVTDLCLYDFNITEIPDIEYTSPLISGSINNGYDSNIVHAMRFNSTNPVTGYKSNVHNSFYYLPYAEYGEEHPDWYSNTLDNSGNPVQLCYTALSESEEAIEITLNIMKEVVAKEGKTKPFISFVHEDNTYWCHCSKCKELEDQYGCVSVGYIRFLNKLASALHSWAEETLGLTNIKVTGMAYHANEAAPTTYDATTDTYKPIDETVVFDDNLCMWYAPHNSDYQVPFDDADSEINKKDIKALRSWGALSSNLLMWTYPIANYAQPIMFYDTFGSMQRNYQLMVQNNTIFLLENGHYNSDHLSGFYDLKVYLSSKLTWNCQADMKALIEKFFDNYYKDAAPYMQTIFEALCNRYTVLHDTGVLSSTYYEFYSSKIHPIGFVDSMTELIDQAYEAIEGLKKTDVTEYNAVKDRICLESLMFRYLNITVHGSRYTQEELLAEKKLFKDDCKRLRMTQYNNSESVDKLWEEWGI